MGILDKFKSKPEPAAKQSPKLEVPKKTAESKPKSSVKVGSISRPVLRKPLVTEKSSLLNAVNQYVFEIFPDVNKIMVADAIKEKYGIKPVKVRIIRLPAKGRTRGKIFGSTRITKKAIVTLPPGKSINMTEGK